MATTINTSVGEKVINGLKKAAVELEEFRLQVALGKAEAKDKYEEAKKIFSAKLHEFHLKFNKVKDTTGKKAMNLKAVFEELHLQLSLGKAETKEIYEEQLKKITKALKKFERFLREHKLTAELYTIIHDEIEKFKVKLEILRFQYNLKKTEIADEFEAVKAALSHKLNELIETISKKSQKAKTKGEHFREEISEAYTHLKKAFVKA